MSTDPDRAPRALPDRPDLRHLKAQARDLLDGGAAASIADAQFQTARLYGFPSWPKLKAHVDACGRSSSPVDPSARDGLVDRIMEFLEIGDPAARAEIRSALEREIDGAGPAALVALKERLTADAGWDFYPPDPLARRIHHLVADRLLRRDSTLLGAGHLAQVMDKRVVLVANHLSYADANMIDVLLERSGAGAIAARLTAIAGPKVFSDRLRRFSSLCFGTIRTPQSASLSSDEAVMSVRETARAARRSIDVAHERLARGDALLVFAEGRRSRSASMQPMLVAAARYMETPGTWIVPVGVAGTDVLYPIDAGTLHPVRIVVRVGVPIDAEELFQRARGDRRVVVDAVGLAIARLLPDRYKGVYGDGNADLREARRTLDSDT